MFEVRTGLGVMESDEYPVVDYRDDDEVWIWINSTTCLAIDKENVQSILAGFDDQNDDEE